MESTLDLYMESTLDLYMELRVLQLLFYYITLLYMVLWVQYIIVHPLRIQRGNLYWCIIHPVGMNGVLDPINSWHILTCFVIWFNFVLYPTLHRSARWYYYRGLPSHASHFHCIGYRFLSPEVIGKSYYPTTSHNIHHACTSSMRSIYCILSIHNIPFICSSCNFSTAWQLQFYFKKNGDLQLFN